MTDVQRSATRAAAPAPDAAPSPAFVSSPDAASIPAAMLATWRAQGADRGDPVGFRFLEALAARTAAQTGAVRALLDARLAQALTRYGEAHARRGAASGRASPPIAPTAPADPDQAVGAGPLAVLLQRLGTPVPAAVPAGASGNRAVHAPAPAPATPAPLKSITQFSGTWSRLRADRRLQQSRAALPDNAGPLNSQQLVHRSLHLMRTLSPDYLNQFMAYVDALAGLERLQRQASAPASAAAPAASRAAAPRATAPRKTARRKG